MCRESASFSTETCAGVIRSSDTLNALSYCALSLPRSASGGCRALTPSTNSHKKYSFSSLRYSAISSTKGVTSHFASISVVTDFAFCFEAPPAAPYNTCNTNASTKNCILVLDDSSAKSDDF